MHLGLIYTILFCLIFTFKNSFLFLFCLLLSGLIFFNCIISSLVVKVIRNIFVSCLNILNVYI